MEEITKRIQYLRDVQNLSFHQIEAETGIHRRKAFRLYSGTWEDKRTHGSYLEVYEELITHWFKETPSLKSIQVYNRLTERGIKTSYRTVSKYTRRYRKKKTKVYWPLEFLPGEEGQVDWFFVNHPKLGKLCGFALILSYSRYLFVHLFPRHSFEFFIEGHLMAFKKFGGYPHALKYDNLRSVVLKKRPLTYNPNFLDFARHYAFDIRLCNLAAGNEKGRVERVIRSLRETFFNIVEHHNELKTLNMSLHEWVDAKNSTVHRTTGRCPVDRTKEERLKPPPQIPWDNVVIHASKKPTKTGMVIFDTNFYSVPDYLTNQLLIIHVYVGRIDIYTADQKKIASHPRCFKRNCKIINPAHRSFARLSKQAKRERIYTVIKNLDPVVEQFLEENLKTGEDPYLTTYQIFKLLKAHSRSTILSAVKEALRNRSPRMKYIVSLLMPHHKEETEDVSPQNIDLLSIDYKPRRLEDYDDEDDR